MRQTAYKTQRESSSSNSVKRYNSSEQRAYDNGFKAVYDDSAYNGRYFIKDGKKWIHNISALKASLGLKRDSELVLEGYDVVTYYAFH